MSVVIDPNIVLDDFGKSLPDTLMAKLQERKVATPMLFSVAAASTEAFFLHVPSYVAGLEVGQRLKVLRGGAVTPSVPQWSFNGEILPRLSFLDIYPHVFIEKDSETQFTAYCSGTRLYVDAASTDGTDVLKKDHPCAYYYFNRETDTDWRQGTVNDTWGGTFLRYINEPLWSNCTLYKLDGSLYIAASDYVPVS